MRRRIWVAAFLIVVVCAWGCQRKLARSPLVFSETNLDPMAQTPAMAREPTVEFLYATDRTYAPNQGGLVPYAAERSLELRVGKARVGIGRADATWDTVQAASRSGAKRGRPRVDLESVTDLGSLWTSHPMLTEFKTGIGGPDPLAAEIERRLSQTDRKEVFVFVHGFKNGFVDSLEVAGQLYHYLGREGAFVAFSWPSADDLSAYFVDKVTSFYSARDFRFLINRIALVPSVEKIHILAHSAGAALTSLALRDLRLLHLEETPEQIQARFKIDNVVLAAPDIDLSLYTQALHDGCLETSRMTTIYASTKDRALGLSKRLFNMTRVGNPFEGLTGRQFERLRTTAGIHLVKVTEAQKHYRAGLGHSYFYQNPWVFSDILLVLKYNLPPDQRGLVPSEGGAVWEFPPDYPQRITQQSARLAGGPPAGPR